MANRFQTRLQSPFHIGRLWSKVTVLRLVWSLGVMTYKRRKQRAVRRTTHAFNPWRWRKWSTRSFVRWHFAAGSFATRNAHRWRTFSAAVTQSRTGCRNPKFAQSGHHDLYVRCSWAPGHVRLEDGCRPRSGANLNRFTPMFLASISVNTCPAWQRSWTSVFHCEACMGRPMEITIHSSATQGAPSAISPVVAGQAWAPVGSKILRASGQSRASVCWSFTGCRTSALWFTGASWISRRIPCGISSERTIQHGYYVERYFGHSARGSSSTAFKY